MESRTVFKLAALACLAALIQGHGYMLDPPQRNSAWRLGFPIKTDHNDVGNFCGGNSVQHNAQNQGRCGVCGEEFSNPNKKFEPSPANEYATGIITGEYQQGDTIDVFVRLTAFHLGYHEFKLCKNEVPQVGSNGNVAVTQDCFEQNVLKSPTGETQFPAMLGNATFQVVLSEDVTCSNCVLQWRYRAGNNWGCEGSDCGLGKGPQEEFWGCSDISILPGNGGPRPTQPTQRPVTTRPTQRPVTTRRPSTTTRRPTRKPVTAQRTTTNSPSTTTSPDTTGQRTCRGHGVFSAPNFDSYCQANCNHYPAYCPPEVCVCDN